MQNTINSLSLSEDNGQLNITTGKKSSYQTWRQTSDLWRRKKYLDMLLFRPQFGPV